MLVSKQRSANDTDEQLDEPGLSLFIGRLYTPQVESPAAEQRVDVSCHRRTYACPFPAWWFCGGRWSP